MLIVIMKISIFNVKKIIDELKINELNSYQVPF